MNLLIRGFIVCIFSLAFFGCSSYPKKPNQISNWAKTIPVNRSVPKQLTPFKLPKEIEYVDAEQKIPKRIVIVNK